MTSHYGKENRKLQYSSMKNLYELICTKGRGFLLPPSHTGCVEHHWKQLDSGFCVCEWCGKEHHCFKGECPEEIADNYDRVCTITGCVTSENELRAERCAYERIGGASVECVQSTSLSNMVKKNLTIKNKNLSSINDTHHHPTTLKKSNIKINANIIVGGGSQLRDVVESTVREILASSKTERCLIQESKRNELKMVALFSKALREMTHDHKCLRPNMLILIAQVAYHCRKNRMTRQSSECVDIELIIDKCTESITSLLLQYGGQRVLRQTQSSSRCREFICSMLYLMRMGITYQNRRLLPKMEILNQILPLQVLLPLVFKIRAKSITEGENIIKLDIRKMPLI
jgi:hypothetical protein